MEGLLRNLILLIGYYMAIGFSLISLLGLKLLGSLETLGKTVYPV